MAEAKGMTLQSDRDDIKLVPFSECYTKKRMAQSDRRCRVLNDVKLVYQFPIGSKMNINSYERQRYRYQDNNRTLSVIAVAAYVRSLL